MLFPSAKLIGRSSGGVLVLGPLVPVMTSDRQPRGVVTRSSYYGSPFFEAWKVFAATAPNFSNSGIDQFAWQRGGVNGSLTHWLSYDFGSGAAYDIRSVDLASFDSGASGETRDFRIEGSNDGSSWVGSPNLVHPRGQARVIAHNFASIGKFRRWRLRVVSVWGTNETTAIIQKLQFFERRT